MKIYMVEDLSTDTFVIVQVFLNKDVAEKYASTNDNYYVTEKIVNTMTLDDIEIYKVATIYAEVPNEDDIGISIRNYEISTLDQRKDEIKEFYYVDLNSDGYDLYGDIILEDESTTKDDIKKFVNNIILKVNKLRENGMSEDVINEWLKNVQ